MHFEESVLKKKIGIDMESYNKFSPLFYDGDVENGDVENGEVENGEIVMADDEQLIKKTGSINNKNNKISPIVIASDFKFNLIKKIIDNLKDKLKDKITVQHQSVGTKILFSNIDDKTLFVDNIKSQKIDFYGFSTRSEQPVKFVLAGLTNCTETQLSEELKNLGLPNPINIRIISLKKLRYEDQVVFCISYNKGDITFADICKTRAIFSTIVRWSKFVKKNQGPTRCLKCQRYGHGIDNCFMTPKCGLCAEGHLINDCPLNKITENERVKKFKCANCNKSHSAGFLECSARTNYQDMKARYKQFKSTQNHEKQYSVSKEMYRPRIADFPQLARPVYRKNVGVPYAKVMASNDLLSFEEINLLIGEVFTELKSCNSRELQVRTIISLTAKYAFGYVSK